MFKCKYCNYQSTLKSNYLRHKKSQSHKMQNQKHTERKEKKHNIILETLEIIVTEQKKIKKQQIISDKKINKINKNVTKIVDYIDFLNEYCLEAKVLKKITCDEAKEMLSNISDEKIIEYVGLKKLHIKIGDLICKKYTKADYPRKQNIWSSDVARMTYMFTQEVEKQKSWTRDKKGQSICKLIIDPIIDNIVKRMIKFLEYNISLYDDNGDNNQDETMKIAQDCANFRSETFINKLKYNILKYTAAKFSICGNREKILLEAEE